MRNYVRKANIEKNKPFGPIWAAFARQWFDKNLTGDELKLARTVFRAFWEDGIAYPPEVHGKSMGLDAQESEDLTTNLFYRMMKAFHESDERAKLHSRSR